MAKGDKENFGTLRRRILSPSTRIRADHLDRIGAELANLKAETEVGGVLNSAGGGNVADWSIITINGSCEKPEIRAVDPSVLNNDVIDRLEGEALQQKKGCTIL